MMEVFVIVPTNRPIWMRLLACLSLALSVTSLFFMLMTGNLAFLPLCAAFGGIFYFVHISSNREYEYSYFDGDVRFARITNKSRRKRLKGYTMEQVLKIAPAGDDSVLQYEKDNRVTVKDYTSKKKQNPYYEMIVKDSENIILYKVELDDKYLDAVCIKYASKVVRKKA